MLFRDLVILEISARCENSLNYFPRLMPLQVCVWNWTLIFGRVSKACCGKHDRTVLFDLLLLKRVQLIAAKLLKAVFVWFSSTEATCPEWKELEQAMTSVHSVVNGLVDFSKVGAVALNLQLYSFCKYLILTNLLKHS